MTDSASTRVSDTTSQASGRGLWFAKDIVLRGGAQQQSSSASSSSGIRNYNGDSTRRQIEKRGNTFWKKCGKSIKMISKMTLDAAVQNRTVVIELAYMGCSLLGSFLILRWALTRNDTSLKAKVRKQKKELAKRWGKNVELDGEFENIIAREVVNPDLIDVTLNDIGGLDHIIDDLRRNVITPMLQPQHFKTSLLRQKRGVLLDRKSVV